VITEQSIQLSEELKNTTLTTIQLARKYGLTRGAICSRKQTLKRHLLNPPKRKLIKIIVAGEEKTVTTGIRRTQDDIIADTEYFLSLLNKHDSFSYYMFGLFLADGSVFTGKTLGNRSVNPVLSWAFGQAVNHLDLLKQLSIKTKIIFRYYISKESKAKGRVIRSSTGYKCTLHNQELCHYFMSLFGAYKDDSYESFKDLEGKAIYSFLSGTLDGDGCVVRKARGIAVYYACTKGAVHKLILHLLDKADIKYSSVPACYTDKLMIVSINNVFDVLKLRTNLYKETPYVDYKKDLLVNADLTDITPSTRYDRTDPNDIKEVQDLISKKLKV